MYVLWKILGNKITVYINFEFSFKLSVKTFGTIYVKLNPINYICKEKLDHNMVKPYMVHLNLYYSQKVVNVILKHKLQQI